MKILVFFWLQYSWQSLLQLVFLFQNLKRSSQKINYQTNWQRHISHWSLSAMVSRLNRLKCTFPERREQNVYDESISCLFRRQNVKRWPFIKKTRIFLCWTFVWSECKSLHWKEAIWRSSIFEIEIIKSKKFPQLKQTLY